MAFGGYLGLFIGASILSLYDISISFFMKLFTKFKSKGDSEIRTEELNAEIKEYKEGQLRTVLNDKSFTPSKKVFSTPLRISPFEVELENSPSFIKMQAELVKQGETIKKQKKLLAKQANILANLEKKISKMYLDVYSRKEVKTG